ncbi:hypothetical protein MEQU1_000382 [Malassezia equina]|uniref:RecQ-mediated genome instability protein 1 n=1 Tax=Malassezia equina TaxID=1381935 RepID=A0AAF0IY39_9BASI|nr:hypothetical protein MEQU1_000382 [Malassezia equina]
MADRGLVHDVRAALCAELGAVPISTEWLTECIDHLCHRDAKLARDATQLVHQVRMQLLASDLHDSLEHAQTDWENALVQIVDVLDVGVSAQSLFDTLETRATTPTTPFPRGMLRWRLSDGFQAPTYAYELERIPSLDLDTRLGTKLVLQRPPQERDVLLLGPAHVRVLGGFHPDWDSAALLQQRICEVLGRSPTWKSATPRRMEAAEAPAVPSAPPTPSAPAVPAPREPELLSDDVWDIDAEQALLEAEGALACAPAPPCAPPTEAVAPSRPPSALLQQLEHVSTPTPPTSLVSSAPPCSNEQLKIPTRGTPVRPSPHTTIILVSSDDEAPIAPTTISVSDSEDEGP